MNGRIVKVKKPFLINVRLFVNRFNNFTGSSNLTTLPMEQLAISYFTNIFMRIKNREAKTSLSSF